MEDFIFDDDQEDVGAEVEAHCPKCRADSLHVIVSKYEDEIRKVQCNVCTDVHAFRKPTGEEEEEPTPTASKKKQKAKPTYDQIMAKLKKQPRPYAINEFFKEPEVLSHPKFGLGFVSENIGEDKIEVTFKEEKKVLVHNRKNLSLPFLRELNPPKDKGRGKKGTTKKSAAARPAAKKPAKAGKPAVKHVVAAAKKKPAKAKSKAARPAAKKPAKAKAKAKPAKKKSR